MTKTKARSCLGKAAYTERAARNEAYRLRRAFASTLRPYHCRFGAHWHLGHGPRPKRSR